MGKDDCTRHRVGISVNVSAVATRNEGTEEGRSVVAGTTMKGRCPRSHVLHCGCDVMDVMRYLLRLCVWMALRQL